jgi:hypothetical protein
MIRVFVILLLGCAAASIAPRAIGQTVVTAAQVNGTWECKHGEFQIWALGQQKLQIAFSGTHAYKSPAGPMANTGEGSGVAVIEGDTAVFKPDGVEDECRITMKFTRDKLVVTQTGVCGFGNNVTAAGTYNKVSTRKPKFDARG